MRKILLGIMAASLLLLAAVAFARPWGMGPQSGTITAEQQQFFDATKDLRKEMHDKRFELMELTRTGTDQAKIDALESDVEALRVKIQAKADALGIKGGPGACGKYDADFSRGQGCGNRGADCYKEQARNCGDGGRCVNQQANAGCGKMSRCGQQ